MLPTHPPSLVGGEATASPCTVAKVWTVGSGTYEGSDANAEWLLMAATVGRRGGCSVGRAGTPMGKNLHGWVSCKRWTSLQETCVCEWVVQELT